MPLTQVLAEGNAATTSTSKDQKEESWEDWKDWEGLDEYTVEEDDGSIDDYLKDITDLSDKEKETYKKTLEELDKNEEELSKLYDDQGKVSDETKIEKAYSTLEELDQKIFEAEVNNNKNLTDKEKKTYLETIKEIQNLEEKIEKAYEKISDTDEKIYNEEENTD